MNLTTYQSIPLTVVTSSVITKKYTIFVWNQYGYQFLNLFDWSKIRIFCQRHFTHRLIIRSEIRNWKCDRNFFLYEINCSSWFYCCQIGCLCINYNILVVIDELGARNITRSIWMIKRQHSSQTVSPHQFCLSCECGFNLTFDTRIYFKVTLYALILIILIQPVFFYSAVDRNDW